MSSSDKEPFDRHPDALTRIALGSGNEPGQFRGQSCICINCYKTIFLKKFDGIYFTLGSIISFEDRDASDRMGKKLCMIPIILHNILN